MIFCVCETFSRETVVAPSRPRMITSRRHPPLLFFGPPTRPTTHTPHNTRSRGITNRGAPDQNRRFATGLARAHVFWGFAQLTTSRSRLARTRHHRRQSNITPEFCGITEFRCPGPTPSDAASPVCPSRHHKAGYGQLPSGSQRTPLSRLPFKRTATTISSHHDMHITSLHITSHAPTDPTGVGS